MRDSRFSFFSQLEFFESNTHNLDDRRLNPLFSRAKSSRLARDTTTAPREREREKEKERKKERPVEYYTPDKGTTTLLMEREKVLREKKRVLSNHKKKKKIQKRDEFRVFLFSKLFFGTQISSSSWDFFKLLFFVFRKNLSQKEERSTEKTTKTPTFTPLDVSSILSDRSNGCGRAFCLLLSLSLFFVKGKKKKRKRADDDDADDVSRNDFVVVLLHGCNEN